MNDLRCLGGSKTQNGRFVSKNCTSLEENQSATKFLCVNTVSDKVVKKHHRLIRAKMVHWGCPLVGDPYCVKIWPKLTNSLQKTPITIDICS